MKRKQRESVPQPREVRFIDVAQCSCDMSKAWKATVENPPLLFHFEVQRKCLEQAFVENDASTPCDFHLRRLATTLMLRDVESLNDKVLIRRLHMICKVARGPSPWYQVIASTKTFGYFDPEGIFGNETLSELHRRHSLGYLKYAPIPAVPTSASKPHTPLSGDNCLHFIPDNISSKFIQDEICVLTYPPNNNIKAFSPDFEWIYQTEKGNSEIPLSLASIAMEQAACYRWHSRETPDGLLPISFFSILQQIIYQDPCLYLHHLQLRKYDNLHLMSYPRPATYLIPKEENIWTRFVSGDENTNTVDDTIIVTTERATIVHQLVPRAADMVRRMRHELEQQDVPAQGYLDLGIYGTTWEKIFADEPLFEKYEAPRGSILFSRSFSPTQYEFTNNDIYQLRLSSGFVATTDEDTEAGSIVMSSDQHTEICEFHGFHALKMSHGATQVRTFALMSLFVGCQVSRKH